MEKSGLILREDFFDLDKIREVRAEDDGAEILCAYLALQESADDEGYIKDDNIPEIAAELDYNSDELRGLIERICEVELGDMGAGGFWLYKPDELE